MFVVYIADNFHYIDEFVAQQCPAAMVWCYTQVLIVLVLQS